MFKSDTGISGIKHRIERAPAEYYQVLERWVPRSKAFPVETSGTRQARIKATRKGLARQGDPQCI